MRRNLPEGEEKKMHSEDVSREIKRRGGKEKTRARKGERRLEHSFAIRREKGGEEKEGKKKAGNIE